MGKERRQGKELSKAVLPADPKEHWSLNCSPRVIPPRGQMASLLYLLSQLWGHSAEWGQTCVVGSQHYSPDMALAMGCPTGLRYFLNSCLHPCPHPMLYFLSYTQSFAVLQINQASVLCSFLFFCPQCAFFLSTQVLFAMPSAHAVPSPGCHDVSSVCTPQSWLLPEGRLPALSSVLLYQVEVFI